MMQGKLPHTKNASYFWCSLHEDPLVGIMQTTLGPVGRSGSVSCRHPPASLNRAEMWQRQAANVTSALSWWTGRKEENQRRRGRDDEVESEYPHHTESRRVGESDIGSFEYHGSCFTPQTPIHIISLAACSRDTIPIAPQTSNILTLTLTHNPISSHLHLHLHLHLRPQLMMPSISPSSSGLLPLPGSPGSSWALYKARLKGLFQGADSSVLVAFWLFGQFISSSSIFSYLSFYYP